MGIVQFPCVAHRTPGLQSPHSPRRSLVSEAMAAGPAEEQYHFAAERLLLCKRWMPEEEASRWGGVMLSTRAERKETFISGDSLSSSGSQPPIHRPPYTLWHPIPESGLYVLLV